MEEKLYDIDMMYVQNTGDKNYVVECLGRHHQTVRLTFTGAEGVEMMAKVPVEVRQSFLQMSEREPKVWNAKFAFPVNLRISMTGKILIEFV
jgi:hypothetical protein